MVNQYRKLIGVYRNDKLIENLVKELILKISQQSDIQEESTYLFKAIYSKLYRYKDFDESTLKTKNSIQ